MERREIARSLLATGFGTALLTARTEGQSCNTQCDTPTPAEVSAGIKPSNYSYPPFNVFRYGATGDGTTDDTAAITTAIRVARVKGGTVYLPQGSYKVSSTLLVDDYSNVYLQGAGVGASVIYPTASVAVALQFGASAGASNQGFSDLSVNCENAKSCTAVYVFAANGFWARNFLIQQANIAILIHEGVIQFYTNWQINRSHTYGIEITGTTGGNDHYFIGGVMSNVGYTQAKCGVNIHASGGAWLEALDIIEQGTGILLNPGNGQSVNWLFAVNCAFDTSAASGIVISPNGTGSVFGCDFTACWTASAIGFGVYLGGNGTINGCRFNGLRCQNNQRHGIVLNSGTNVTNTSFSNCDVSGNCAPPSAPGSHHGIFVGAGVGGFSVTNCRIGQEDNYGQTQGHGIFVSGGASNNYLIHSNDVRGNLSGGISDAGTGTTKIVKDNLGFNPFPQTSILVGESPFTFTNNTGSPVIVYVQGGIVSSVQAATGLIASNATNVAVSVPHGSSIMITYSAAPTMVYLGT